jgi:hypothetical protein
MATAIFGRLRQGAPAHLASRPEACGWTVAATPYVRDTLSMFANALHNASNLDYPYVSILFSSASITLVRQFFLQPVWER